MNFIKQAVCQFSTHFVVFSPALRKKLTAASKLKKYGSITPWINAIINHFYWCAVSSEGQPDLILPKWRSLAAHIANVHTHDDQLYPRCQHDALPNKKWLEEGTPVFLFCICFCIAFLCFFSKLIALGSPAHQKVKAIILNKALLRDMPKLSTSAQTFAAESFHSTIIQFAPKATHFHYSSMVAR